MHFGGCSDGPKQPILNKKLIMHPHCIRARMIAQKFKDPNPLKDRLGAYRRLPLYLDWITCKNGYFNPKNMILGSGRVGLGKKHVFFLKKNAKHAILAHLEG